MAVAPDAPALVGDADQSTESEVSAVMRRIGSACFHFNGFGSLLIERRGPTRSECVVAGVHASVSAGQASDFNDSVDLASHFWSVINRQLSSWLSIIHNKYRVYRIGNWPSCDGVARLQSPHAWSRSRATRSPFGIPHMPHSGHYRRRQNHAEPFSPRAPCLLDWRR